MFEKVFKKLKDNGLDALGQALTGNPIGAIGTLIGKPDIQERELLKQLDTAEVLKILKEHEYRMKKLEKYERIEYIRHEEYKMKYVLDRFLAESADRKNARNMYVKTGGVFQNRFAIFISTVCLIIVAGIILFFVYKPIPDVVLPIITNVLGNITGVLLTVISFYFGGMSKDD